MKKIKEQILDKSLELFNTYGVSEVSIRQIASDLNISHSNLIYHFKTKNDILIALHNQLLDKALRLNQETKDNTDFIKGLLDSIRKGFEILYQYRFFMIDSNHVIRESKELQQTFILIEKTRASMYRETIQKAIESGYMQNEEYENEYNSFIEHIKIFSDSWIASSQIYDSHITDSQSIIEKYTVLFVKLFFPYLTKKGKQEFIILLDRSKK